MPGTPFMPRQVDAQIYTDTLIAQYLCIVTLAVCLLKMEKKSKAGNHLVRKSYVSLKVANANDQPILPLSLPLYSFGGQLLAIDHSRKFAIGAKYIAFTRRVTRHTAITVPGIVFFKAHMVLKLANGNCSILIRRPARSKSYMWHLVHDMPCVGSYSNTTPSYCAINQLIIKNGKPVKEKQAS